MTTFAVSTSIILPLPSSPHCTPTKIVLAIAIRNGQKIFPMHPAGHSRDCLRIICWQQLRAREFALMFRAKAAACNPRLASSRCRRDCYPRCATNVGYRPPGQFTVSVFALEGEEMELAA